MGDRKKTPTLEEQISQIDLRNRSNLGYKASDFGITTINATPGLGNLAISFQGGPQTMAGNPAQAMVGSTTGTLPVNTPASNFLTPQEQQQVNQFVQNAPQVQAGSGPIDAAKTFLGNLFDTTDTYDPKKQTPDNPTGWTGTSNPVETVWDSFLGGLGWGYNRLNQLTVAGLSGLPGGTQTLTWDEANNVSVGQEVVAGIGQSVARLRRGEGSAGDIFAAVATPINWIGAAGAAINQDSAIQDPSFNITNAKDRAVFESGPEKFFSGVTDFGFVFADPLILGGKLTKLSRLKWVDRPMDTVASRQILAQELADGATAIATGQGKVSPAAEFINWVSQKTPEGNKVVSMAEIARHKMLKNAPMREQIVSALHQANDYDTAALVFRYAKGDVDAGRLLFEKRADIVDGMAAAERQRIMTMYAINPTRRQRVEKIMQNAVNKANDRVFALEEAGQKGSNEWALATRYRDNLNKSWEDVVNGNFDTVNMATPEGVAAAKKIYTDLVSNNKAIMKAIGDAESSLGGIGGALAQRGRIAGIPSNTILGRAVEASRQRRATAAVQAEQSRGAMIETGRVITRKDGSRAIELKNRTPLGKGYWKADVFGQNGFTRTFRLWRWAGEENPVGYITTRGIGAQDSWRELNAVLNDINIYSGNERAITLADGKVITVGGVKRKQQLLDMYMNVVQDTTKGADHTQQVLDRIENLIQSDVMAWHGVPKDMADQVLSRARQARADVLDSIKNQKFFVGDGEIAKAPWLEQHLQNGTYMLNYRALEKAAREFDEQGLIKFADASGKYIGDNFMRVYSTFNDIWRPAVLLRLGYTLRNVTEGQFRAAAFTQSIDPLRYGIESGYLSARSSAARFMGKKALEKAENAARMRAAGSANVAMPKRYQKWLGDQIIAREAETARLDGIIRNTGEELAQMGPTYRDWMIKYYEDAQNAALDGLIRARNVGASADEIAARQADIDEAFAGLQRMNKIKTFTGINDASENAFYKLRVHKSFWEQSNIHRNSLDDEMIAVAQYGQQSRSHRRIFSNPIPTVDGNFLQGAFDPDSPFTPVALSLLSADGTQQSMLQLTMDMSDSLFKAKRMRHYVDVEPGQEKYFDGFAKALNDIKNSDIGSRILRGEDDESIVSFLMDDKNGKETMDFLMQGRKWDKGDALEMVTRVRERFMQIAPSAKIREFVRTSKGTIEARSLEALAGKTGTTFTEDLAPVIGSIGEDVGTKSAMDTWRQATSWTMKWLGTVPEDAFVRTPFYGTRYTQIAQGLYNDLRNQVGSEFISFKDLANITRVAHAGALKDTKDWLYTIDRRTNLGTYGEIGIPFVSAFQNSITTVGRLIWNDPTTAVIAADLWRAPAAAGFEDSEGNIVIPIPHSMVPDSIEKMFGIDQMQNWKIKKSSLNVVMPESGFGFVPRPGPVVGVPASELMKRGLFMSVESPDWLRNSFGKEGADQVWTLWKNWLFGEGQGIAPDPLSLSMLQPPVAAKVVQMIQGEGNAQFGYYYSLIQRSMMADWLGGRRDAQPTPEEIMNQTRGFYVARILGNLLAFTPPAYESKVDPLIKQIRAIQQQYPEDASRIINEQYGPFLQMLGDFSNSKNWAGMAPTADAVEIARKHSDLINQVSPGLERLGDLSVLSMLTTGGTANALYDDSAYGWQFANRIPGVNQTFREMQTPEQAWAQSRVNAGWTEYLKVEDSIQARLAERGLTNIRQAPDLQMEREVKLTQMASNPLYKEWWQDYKEFGSSRTLSAVSLMESALSNPKFMQEYGNTPVWSAAAQYLYHRNYVMSVLSTRQGGIDAQDNQDVRAYWDQARAYLNQNKDWAAVSNRFLNGDDNPQEPGVQLASYYVVPSLGVSNG